MLGLETPKINTLVWAPVRLVSLILVRTVQQRLSERDSRAGHCQVYGNFTGTFILLSTTSTEDANTA